MKIFKFIILLTIIIFTLVSRSLLYNDSDIFNSVIKILSSIFAIIMSYYAVVVLKINVTLPKKESTKHSFYPYFLLLVVLLNIYFITWPRTISDFNFLNVSFLVLAVFLAAAAEEFIFRYLSYNFLFNLTNKTQKSVLFSSILFALIHLINLKHAVNITSIINQVVFAFFLGVLLSSLFLY